MQFIYVSNALGFLVRRGYVPGSSLAERPREGVCNISARVVA